MCFNVFMEDVPVLLRRAQERLAEEARQKQELSNRRKTYSFEERVMAIAQPIIDRTELTIQTAQLVAEGLEAKKVPNDGEGTLVEHFIDPPMEPPFRHRLGPVPPSRWEMWKYNRKMNSCIEHNKNYSVDYWRIGSRSELVTDTYEDVQTEVEEVYGIYLTIDGLLTRICSGTSNRAGNCLSGVQIDDGIIGDLFYIAAKHDLLLAPPSGAPVAP